MQSPFEETGLEELGVLIVDDNRHFRKVARNLLRALKISRIYEAEDARSALDALKSDAIDLIMTGLVMKPVSGIKLAEGIRKSEGKPYQKMPIIGMTLYSSFETIVKARDAGVNEILAKPLSARQLERHIRALIKDSRDFVKGGSFVGPDRRRHKGMRYEGPERRADEPIGKSGAYS